MSAGVNAVIDIKKQQEIMIIGLGGGGLCMFLHHCFPKVCIFTEFIVKLWSVTYLRNLSVFFRKSKFFSFS